jgi:hypothetical protein
MMTVTFMQGEVYTMPDQAERWEEEMSVIQAFAAFAPVMQILFYVVAIYAAIAGVRVYKANSRLERAKWLTALYEKFYERPDLKAMRDRLDGESQDSKVIQDLVKGEEPELTDYLNFFEYIAVLESEDIKQLSLQNVKDLFEYYLRNLASHRTVREYIEQSGYERLQALLKRL